MYGWETLGPTKRIFHVFSFHFIMKFSFGSARKSILFFFLKNRRTVARHAEMNWSSSPFWFFIFVFPGEKSIEWVVKIFHYKSLTIITKKKWEKGEIRPPVLDTLCCALGQNESRDKQTKFLKEKKEEEKKKRDPIRRFNRTKNKKKNKNIHNKQFPPSIGRPQ